MTMIPKTYTMQAVDKHQCVKLHNTLLCGSFSVLKWRFSSSSFKLLQGFLSCFKEYSWDFLRLIFYMLKTLRAGLLIQCCRLG